MQAPQLSVVLPTRNRSSMLMKALRSALDQEAVELEVLVVDQGSSNDTQERLDGVDDRRLTVLRHDSAQGLDRARNAAISTTPTLPTPTISLVACSRTARSAVLDRSPGGVAGAVGALGDVFRCLGRYAEARIMPRPNWLDRHA